MPRARARPRAAASSVDSGSPFQLTFPAVGATSPPRTCRSVVLPDPERPQERKVIAGRDRQVDARERLTRASPWP